MLAPSDDAEAGPTRDPLSVWESFGPGFRIHVTAFIAVMLILAAFDWWTAEPYWAHWVFLGWGAGLSLHGYRALRKRSSGAS